MTISVLSYFTCWRTYSCSFELFIWLGHGPLIRWRRNKYVKTQWCLINKTNKISSLVTPSNYSLFAVIFCSGLKYWVCVQQRKKLIFVLLLLFFEDELDYTLVWPKKKKPLVLSRRPLRWSLSTMICLWSKTIVVFYLYAKLYFGL